SARGGQAVFDAGGGYIFDKRARDSGDGKNRARTGEGRRERRDNRDKGDEDDGGDGSGDVQEVIGQRDGRRQCRVIVKRDGSEGYRARAGDSEARKYNAAHSVQGRGVCVDEGRRREAHTIFQWVQAAVLFSDYGCDRSSDVRRRSRDGDARRQFAIGDRVDKSDSDGERVEVCDKRGRADGRSRNCIGDYRVNDLAPIPASPVGLADILKVSRLRDYAKR